MAALLFDILFYIMGYAAEVAFSAVHMVEAGRHLAGFLHIVLHRQHGEPGDVKNFVFLD